MRLFLVFARAYPVSSALMVLGLVTAALAEGIGVTTMLPLFAMVMKQQDGSELSSFGPSEDIEARVAAVLGSFGLEPTIGVQEVGRRGR